MKKVFSVAICAAVIGWAGSAMALPSEWGVIDTDLTGSAVGDHSFGYYISADASRTNWEIKWEAGTSLFNPKFFSGNIELQNATGSFSSIDFEWLLGDGYIVNGTGNGVTFWSLNSNGYDGIGFSITQTGSPSYVGFDLKYDSLDMNPNYIYLGNKGVTVFSLGQDEDFAFAAPVPEPTTMLLFGAGLAGLAAVGRRRKN